MSQGNVGRGGQWVGPKPALFWKRMSGFFFPVTLHKSDFNNFIWLPCPIKAVLGWPQLFVCVLLSYGGTHLKPPSDFHYRFFWLPVMASLSERGRRGRERGKKGGGERVEGERKKGRG